MVVDRLGPVVEGALEEAGATVGAGENAVPTASQPGPQRPWEATTKATVKATRAKTENPATRTRRLACQPSVRVTTSLETRSTRPAWAFPAAAANGAQDGAFLAAALRSAGAAAGGGAAQGGRERAGRPDLDRRVPVELGLGLGTGRGGRFQAGQAEGRAEVGGLERPLQQRPGRVGGGRWVPVPAIGEHDQLAPVAVADLGQGGVGAIAGQVEHDRVGVGRARPGRPPRARR